MTVHEAGAVELRGTARRSLALGSVWLLLAKGLQMGAGFLFWVVAANTASVESVGIAAACVSGVMLCTQLGVLGTGSAVIISLGRGERPKQVLDTALSILTVASLVAAGGYLAVTWATGSSELDSTLTGWFAALFTGAALLGTVVICLDQASIALHKTEGAATRYAVGGVAALAAVLLVWATAEDVSATVLLACWSLGALGAALVGQVQLIRWVGYRFSPSLRLTGVRRVLRLGVPNQLLTATERLTPVLVPIVLAHFASVTTTAFWYPAWMMAWVALNAPISVGMVQFHHIVRHPERARALVRQGLLWSLLLGGAVSLVAAVGARFFLSLLGDEYADASVTALRVLLLGLLPFVVLQAYNATCRAVGRTTEAIVLGGLLMAAVCVGAAVLGTRGTTAVALVWVVASSVAALWAAWRLHRVLPDAGRQESA